ALVSLATINDPQLILPAIAQTLKIKEHHDQPLAAYLMDYLADKHLLLVLDNFEQVQPGGKEIATLMGAAPAIKVLVTSRAMLQISGEYNFTVPPLAV